MIAAEEAGGDARAAAPELVETAGLATDPSSRNRRMHVRSPFDCVQLVAPYDGTKLPTQADFRHVVCRDISSSGISFLSAQRVNTQLVIIALGPIPFSFVVAEVVRSEFSDEGEILVGCRFVERLRP